MKNLIKVLILLLLLVPLGCGGGDDDDEQQEFVFDPCTSIGLKVINGEACALSDNQQGSPVVRLRNTDTTGKFALCTGTAISGNAVLTAAHCFIRGSTHLEVDTVFGTHVASSVVLHPEFSVRVDLGSVLNDVAIVFTSTPLNVATFPILISRNAEVGEEGVIAGVGQNDADEFGGLEGGNVFISDVTTQHIFTDFDGSGSNPCFGDSGGPLLVQAGPGLAIAGVVSSGDPTVEDCGPGDTTLYANLANPTVGNFIRQQVSGVAIR